jgi:hypothetical protein
MLTGCKNAYGGQHAARVFETPDLSIHDPIFVTKSLCSFTEWVITIPILMEIFFYFTWKNYIEKLSFGTNENK